MQPLDFRGFSEHSCCMCDMAQVAVLVHTYSSYALLSIYQLLHLTMYGVYTYVAITAITPKISDIGHRKSEELLTFVTGPTKTGHICTLYTCLEISTFPSHCYDKHVL